MLDKEISIQSVENFYVNGESTRSIIRLTDPEKTKWESVETDVKEIHGLYTKICFEDAKFKHTPFINAILAGTADSWVMQLSVGEVTPEYAIIYIRSDIKKFRPDPAFAESKKWHIRFSATSPSNDDRIWMDDRWMVPYPPHCCPCDNA